VSQGIRGSGLRFLAGLVFGWELLLAAGCGTPPRAASPGRAPSLAQRGVTYALLARSEPRPLRIHRVRVDLQAEVEIAAVVAEDPDGPGPAEAALVLPAEMAARSRALVLVNANAFGQITREKDHVWIPGLPVTIAGLAVMDGVMRSPAEPAFDGFWIDAAGAPRFGVPQAAAGIRQGVAGFRRLLRAGEICAKPGGPLHPRTAVGVDATGRWLHLVVVDGRQKGCSEGMSEYELAACLRTFGCSDALNLDGGGSSILLLASAPGAPRIVNSPSTQVLGLPVPRPIPVALVVRGKASAH